MFAAEEVSWLFRNVWLIPALPALSFVLILFFGKRLPFKGAEIGIASVVVAFSLAVLTTFAWIGNIQSAESHSEEAIFLEGPDGEQTPIVLTAEEAGEARGAPIITEVEWFSIGPDANKVILGTEGNSDAGHDEDGHSDDEDEDGHSDDEDAGHDDDEEEGAGFGGDDNVVDVAFAEDGGTVAEAHGDRFSISIGTLVDGQSVMMLFVVTFISLLVHVYSTDYVKGDRRFTHYFAFLSLFTSAMLFMVLSTSTMQLIVGWELVGVCSFALIGHWWEEKANSDAALKAFLTNRVGDIGLLIGMSILYFAAGRTFSIPRINELAVNGTIPKGTLTIAAVCLMAAVMSKSGQFILHTWLPDAMAGPTPVSALIHAATMVVAGVYMIGRLYPVFFIGFGIAGSSINLMAFIGGLTTVGGGALAFVQKDIKKVLAYSTVSQLGYMVLALGMGAYTAGMFHLFTHAFFKACLFLGAGSVSHACHHSFDMKADMGGLRKYMPKTFWTFMIGSGALAGIPPLAGFWSKDEILVGAGVWPNTGGNGTYYLPFVFGMITAAMTAAYMARTIWLTFFGEYRGHDEPHESGARITTPLIILAGMAVVVGFLNMPSGFVKFFGAPEGLAHRFEDWVEPAGVSTFVTSDNGFTHAKPSLSLAIVATLLALTAGGAVVAYYRALYAKDSKATEYTDGVMSRIPGLRAGHKFLEEKYYLDHLYTGAIAGGTKGPLARATDWFNQNVLDGIVNGVGKLSVGLGNFIYNIIDQKAIDGVVNGSGNSASGAGQFLRGMQTGQVRQYATLMFGATAVVAAIFIFAV